MWQTDLSVYINLNCDLWTMTYVEDSSSWRFCTSRPPVTIVFTPLMSTSSAPERDLTPLKLQGYGVDSMRKPVVIISLSAWFLQPFSGIFLFFFSFFLSSLSVSAVSTCHGVDLWLLRGIRVWVILQTVSSGIGQGVRECVCRVFRRHCVSGRI